MDREFYQGLRCVTRRETLPGAIVMTGSVPLSSLWTIPRTMIEKDAHIKIQNHIHICPRDHHYLRWGWK